MRYSFKSFLQIGCLISLLGLWTSEFAVGQSRTYTNDADFDEGVLSNVNHDAPDNNQLQLNKGTAAFPFVNIAASQRGTAVRAQTETGVITGEYLTAPDGMGRNPSRTTVDQLGNAWVGNRNEFGAIVFKGSLTRIGLIVGGTRTDASGNPDAAGQYLKGPFSYNTCQDRHGATVGTPADGLIKTSTGLGNFLPWSNAGNVDALGGVSTAEDECIINYTRAGSPQTRTITIDKNNDVWVGGTGNRQHEKVSGVTGLPIPGTEFTFACGGYGGFIDGNGILWSMTSGGSYLRYDTNTSTGACIALSNYGTGVDPTTGEIWITQLFGNLVHKVNPATGAAIASYNHGFDNAQGVVVDSDGNVWVAHALFSGTTVGHLKTDGTFVGNVTLPGGHGPTGVAVDAAGKVWVANINSNNAMRIDPDAGPIGGGGFPVGAVDLIVELGAGAGPYNYSDMTGAVVAGVTAPQGTWTVVHNGGASGIDWSSVSWTSDEPAGTSVTVEIRSADVEADLGSESYAAVTNGGALSGVTGQFIQIRATLARDPAVTASPILFDLAVSADQATDVTAAVCGPIVLEKDPNGALTAVNSSTMDAESGIASIKFTKLVNLSGFLDGAGPYSQGNTVPFDPATTTQVDIRGERIDMTKGGSIVVLVTNGAGLTSKCDPVLETVGAEIPVAFDLEQNYPNPFNPSTTISFKLAEAAHVMLRVYDVTGHLVVTLLDQTTAAGSYQLEWDGRNAQGGAVASGTYLYRLDAGELRQARTMILTK